MKVGIPPLALLAFVLFCSLLGTVHAADPAGEVAFVSGPATATAPDGKTRVLQRADPVYPGDTVATSTGRVQLRFRDGGFVSLIPETSFKVEEFRWTGRTDGSESGVFRLLKGGLRALTGAIGKVNRGSYRLETVVATIGIRGTLFRAQLDDRGRLLVSVGFDPRDPSAVVVSNVAGSLVVDAGQNAVVESPDAAPRYTTEQPALAAAQTGESPATAAAEEEAEPVFQQADQVTPESVVETITESLDLAVSTRHSAGTGLRSNDPLELGSRLSQLSYRYLSAGTLFGVIHETPQESLRTVNPNLMLLVDDPTAAALAREYIDGARANNPHYDDLVAEVLAKPAQRTDEGGDDIVGWGRWVDGRQLVIDRDGGLYTAFVREYGLPYQSGHGVSLEIPDHAPAPVMAYYDFMGGTRSTSLSGATIGDGVVSGQLAVDFGANVMAVNNMVVRHGQDYAVGNFNAVPIFDDFYFSNSGGKVSAAAGPCISGNCYVRIRGAFGGNSPDHVPLRAGMSYDIGTNSTTGQGNPRDTLPDPIHGVAAFKRSSP